MEGFQVLVLRNADLPDEFVVALRFHVDGGPVLVGAHLVGILLVVHQTSSDRARPRGVISAAGAALWWESF